MAKILLYSDINNRLSAEGCELLGVTYKNSRTYGIKYKCANGHIREVTWKNWTQGRRCMHCVVRKGKKIVRKPILSYEEIESRLNKEGYVLLDTIYKGNCLTKIEYVCPAGHRQIITWKNWIQGRRCKLCRLKKYAIEKRLGISALRESLAADNYTLLSNKYTNSKTKFKYKCPYGHINSMIWTNWKKGQRCPTCKAINMSGDKHHAWKGGIACEPYCDAWADKEYKESIKERDNNECQNPNCWGTSKRLTIHHIDYVKKNCRPENLITLCNSCNARANFDREWHTLWYSLIMNEKGDYSDRKD